MSKILAGLMGVCVGDALGVPVEFTSRGERMKNPVTGMIGYGSYNQPPGTWSDDSSLTLCLADSLCGGYDVNAIAQSFCRWYEEAFWTARGEVFDIGHTTGIAIWNLQQGVSPIEAGVKDERSNGNGSLMRILPLAYYHKTLDLDSLIQRVHEVSCITHAHVRSQIACGIYISIAVGLLEGLAPQSAYIQGLERVRQIYAEPKYNPEAKHFQTILSGEIDTLPINAIQSSGYVIHTLEAALWCFLTSSSYADAVIKAVNLGEDTDTVAAVTGGLAGIYYGIENIPAEWIDLIARKDDIVDLATRLEAKIF
jgi:ADP-ribosyl-[dinitrogen reductase] hydrolase